MSRKIPDALVAHAAKLIQDGSNLKNAALAIGCNPDELSKKLRTIGVKKIDKRRDWNALADQIVGLYGLGMGTTAIADHIGVPRHAASNIRNVLNRAGIMRDRSSANSVRYAGETPAKRKAGIAKARKTRRNNMIRDAESSVTAHGIGMGEREIADLLEDRSFAVRRQVVIDEYLIDIAVGTVAVEVKTSMISAHITKFNSQRFKKIAEAGFSILFVVVNHLPLITKHANDLIAAIEIAQANPTASGEYWVVRCTLEQIGSDLDVDHWAVERRTPKPGRERF